MRGGGVPQLRYPHQIHRHMYLIMGGSGGGEGGEGGEAVFKWGDTRVGGELKKGGRGGRGKGGKGGH